MIAIFGVSFAALGSVAFGWVADATFGRETWHAFVQANFELVIGTPMAAALAFCIVMMFYGSFEGPLGMKIGILEIEAPLARSCCGRCASWSRSRGSAFFPSLSKRGHRVPPYHWR